MNLRSARFFVSGDRGRWFRPGVVLGLCSAALLMDAACLHRPSKSGAAEASPNVARKAVRPTTARLPTATPTPVPPEQRLGTVRVIGAHGGFVLIETASALVTAAVPVGAVLHCHPPGQAVGASTADLRVSPERRSPFVVADVLAGVPSVGDVAYLANAAPTPVSSPEPGPAPSTLLPAASEPAPSPDPTP